MSSDRPLRARYRRILGFFARLTVQMWFFDVVLPRVGLRRLAARGRTRRFQKAAARFHTLAAELGGLMIKLGQFMSTRLDVLPPEVTEELAGLQDEAPEVPFPQIRPLAEAELGMPLSAAFESFESTPVAAASLGQVHRARLSPSEARDVGFRNVMVKVQRPGIEQVIDIDLTALRKVAGWASHLKAISQRTDMHGIVEEFARSSAEEIDYLHEASNGERFAANFADDPTISAPVVVWERTSRRVLTLSDVSAIKVDDIAALNRHGIDPHEVAYAVADAYIKQVFEDGFFHADPHPGNLFVTPVPDAMVGEVGRRRKLTFIDFRMMGEVPGDLRGQLKDVIIAIGLRDSQRLVRCMEELHMLLPSADRSLLERAVGQLFDRFGGMSLAEMRELDPKEFIDFGRQFRDLMREMPFQLPEDFLLLIRAASLMNGLCTALDPDYNLWDSVQPYADQLVTGDPGSQAKMILDEGRALLEITLGLPRRLTRVLTMVERGQLSVEIPEIERQLSHIEVGVRRVVAAVLFVGLLLGGILLRGNDPMWGLIMMGVSLVPLAYAVFGGLFRRFRV
ncbi:Putative unusual protein kinase [Propionibacterium freudenreichii]|nr:Putative unusual protein kinase [Propionibacterium freudenreichii]SCQ54574.1 Putative unusual protein kinase [Propionibacterium freudenreichii]